jgi:hypothetical protein
MRWTKEEYLAWCRAVIATFDKHEELVVARLSAFEEHDPMMAELERQGIAAARRTVEYLRARLEGRWDN